MEGALARLTDLEAQRLLPPGTAPPAKESFILEAYDGAGKLRFRLAATGASGAAGVDVTAREGDKTTAAVLSSKDFAAWQKEMDRLTAPPPTKG